MKTLLTLLSLTVLSSVAYADVWKITSTAPTTVWAITETAPQKSKASPCSGQCVCGCNSGQECTCGKANAQTPKAQTSSVESSCANGQCSAPQSRGFFRRSR